MTHPLIVTFDRSAFHGRHFNLLAESPLLALTKRNTVTVHHSQALLEETVSMYEKERNHEELRKQLPFILDICNGRWFRPQGEIWDLELRQNLGAQADVFEDEALRKITEGEIREAVSRGGEWDALKRAIPEKDIEREKQAGFHHSLSQMRAHIAERKRQDRRLKQQKGPTLREFIAAEIDGFGAVVIPQHVATSYAALLIRRWQEDKDRYPFFTSSLEGRAYAAWHAMVEHNKPLDPNAQIDLDVLTSLNRADAIVSADEKFQKEAFDVLWAPKGKRFFTPAEFVHYLEPLVAPVPVVH